MEPRRKLRGLMEVLVLIDKLDDLVRNARAGRLTKQLRVDKEEIHYVLQEMRATLPEEMKQARWIVKKREEMLSEAEGEAERIVKEAREREERLWSERAKMTERAAEAIIADARASERQVLLGAEDYAEEILNTLEVELSKFIATARRERDRCEERGAAHHLLTHRQATRHTRRRLTRPFDRE